MLRSAEKVRFRPRPDHDARVAPRARLERPPLPLAVDGSVAQLRQRRLAQNEECAGSNPARTTEKHPNWFAMALLFANQFKGF